MTVRVVVVGAGHLGTYHMQKVAALEGAALVGAVDTDPAQRAKAATTFGVQTEPSLDAFAGRAEAAIIAAPTTHHHGLASLALGLGMHVLVEKPITPTLAEADDLIEQARGAGLVLQVGHTERYNPAVMAALPLVDRPHYVVSERLAPFTGRSTDVDVVLDLMIHDLDIVASVVPAELVEVRAIGVPILTNEVDMAAARLAFANGTVAQLSAGRASFEPVRKVRFFTEQRYVSVDCQAREVKAVRRLPPPEGSPWPEIQGEPVEVTPGDPLATQAAEFVRAIASSTTPRVDGVAGRRALALARAVKDALVVPAR